MNLRPKSISTLCDRGVQKVVLSRVSRAAATNSWVVTTSLTRMAIRDMTVLMDRQIPVSPTVLLMRGATRAMAASGEDHFH